ncbi:hypothetical protein DFH07DRAFT_1025387 [Mycena maculata]|uniref:Uncharacterized protein n=1 Tax=Mycena maculata TaxID=230809 RepID=A0AAD7NDE6_9AGAR|nr:hypothetical protein DFH07DRAFT_1025387 [Mycena maculata]
MHRGPDGSTHDLARMATQSSHPNGKGKTRGANILFTACNMDCRASIIKDQCIGRVKKHPRNIPLRPEWHQEGGIARGSLHEFARKIPFNSGPRHYKFHNYFLYIRWFRRDETEECPRVKYLGTPETDAFYWPPMNAHKVNGPNGIQQEYKRSFCLLYRVQTWTNFDMAWDDTKEMCLKLGGKRPALCEGVISGVMQDNDFRIQSGREGGQDAHAVRQTPAAAYALAPLDPIVRIDADTASTPPRARPAAPTTPHITQTVPPRVIPPRALAEMPTKILVRGTQTAGSDSGGTTGMALACISLRTPSPPTTRNDRKTNPARAHIEQAIRYCEAPEEREGCAIDMAGARKPVTDAHGPNSERRLTYTLIQLDPASVSSDRMKMKMNVQSALMKNSVEGYDTNGLKMKLKMKMKINVKGTTPWPPILSTLYAACGTTEWPENGSQSSDRVKIENEDEDENKLQLG